MEEATLNLIYSLIFTGFIVGVIIFITSAIVKACSNYDKNERQSTVKREPEQQAYQQQYATQPTFERLPYYLRSTVLTNYEKKLYYVLAPFCSKHGFVLLSKIRIADFVQPVERRNYHWLNRITSKHVDFLICANGSFKPLLAIELDDYTHQYQNRQDRDYFVNSVYYSVGLPVLHITDINNEKIEGDIAGILGLNLSTIL